MMHDPRLPSAERADVRLDEIIEVYWPLILRWVMATSDDAFLRGFVRSIAHHRKKATWHPTFRQERLMRRLTIEYLADTREDVELIEEE